MKSQRKHQCRNRPHLRAKSRATPVALRNAAAAAAGQSERILDLDGPKSLLLPSLFEKSVHRGRIFRRTVQEAGPYNGVCVGTSNSNLSLSWGTAGLPGTSTKNLRCVIPEHDRRFSEKYELMATWRLRFLQLSGFRDKLRR